MKFPSVRLEWLREAFKKVRGDEKNCAFDDIDFIFSKQIQ